CKADFRQADTSRLRSYTLLAKLKLSRYYLQVRTSFPTPVIYRSGTKIVRTNKFQNIAKKLCFYLVDYSENAIFAMS
ncbi:hypothetical protein, partial [Phocaeicola barnesiae]|uniref:hypothetical protein n=1 Tax=Phocaeicola barnesiae TaxID=376804 RepID=UPI0025A3F232